MDDNTTAAGQPAASAITVNIVPYSTFDEGIEMRFRGVPRDDEGEPIGEMIETTLIVPPLNMFNLKRLQKYFNSITNLSDENLTLEAMGNIAEILLPALAQNYRGVPRWLVEQSVNPANVAEITQAVMDVSGLKRKEIAAEKKAMAAATLQPTTETTGTPSSAT